MAYFLSISCFAQFAICRYVQLGIPADAARTSEEKVKTKSDAKPPYSMSKRGFDLSNLLEGQQQQQFHDLK